MRFPTVSDREKRAKLIELLDIGKVRVVVDTTVDGVDVPPHLAGQRDLHLNLSRRFQLEVFEVGPQAVRASLSFGGERHLVVVPWPSVYIIIGNGNTDQTVYPEDVPEEAMRAARMMAADPLASAPTPAHMTPPPEASAPDEDDPDPDDTPPRPTLRLVKP